MDVFHPNERNCSRNHAARSCSRKVGAGTRQSCTWTSLIHCFSRVKNCKHSRTPGWSASSVTFVPVNAELAAMLAASVPGGARHKCSCTDVAQALVPAASALMPTHAFGTMSRSEEHTSELQSL